MTAARVVPATAERWPQLGRVFGDCCASGLQRRPAAHSAAVEYVRQERVVTPTNPNASTATTRPVAVIAVDARRDLDRRAALQATAANAMATTAIPPSRAENR